MNTNSFNTIDFISIYNNLTTRQKQIMTSIETFAQQVSFLEQQRTERDRITSMLEDINSFAQRVTLLRKSKYVPYKNINVNVDDICSICRGLQDDNVQLKCNHVFHKECIELWFNKIKKYSCPMCRQLTL